MNHHVVQNGLVRMLYDPAFAERVRRDPRAAGYGDEEGRALASIDPRALRGDPLRRRRTLGTLVEEFKAGTALAAAETRSVAFLEGFFGAPEFHASVEERRPLALAFGAYLLAACASGQLREPLAPDVIRLERMQAITRREAAPVEHNPRAHAVRLAPGVVFERLAGEVFEAAERVDQLLFELQLVPQQALCDDGPKLVLPPRDPGREPIALLSVPVGGGISLVTLDEELEAVIAPLGRAGAALGREPLVSEAAARIGRARAEEVIAELLDDEVLAPA